jgi:hypothetical protein
MTKRDMLATLQERRDEAWQECLRYITEKDVHAWPEQRNGALTMKDIEAARLRGRVSGLDIAMEVLGLKK